jgi:hypothetical protein
MIRQRIYGIIADYEDQNDHEFLRRDAIFKMIAGRSPDDPIHLALKLRFLRILRNYGLA